MAELIEQCISEIKEHYGLDARIKGKPNNFILTVQESLKIKVIINGDAVNIFANEGDWSELLVAQRATALQQILHMVGTWLAYSKRKSA